MTIRRKFVPTSTSGSRKRKWRADCEMDEEENPVEKRRVRWEEEDLTEEAPERNTSIDSEESSDSEVVEKICLTACCQNQRIGAAYYDPIKCIVYTLHDTAESSHFDLTNMILEQVNPDVVLVSSRSDEIFIDMIRDRMDASNGLFQIRSQKDFSASKGRDRLLSLPLLSDLPQDEFMAHSSSDIDSGMAERRNAYDYMRKRSESVHDPLTKRWNASIRLANSISVETSPFCVRPLNAYPVIMYGLHRVKMASVGALLDHLVRERAMSFDDEGIHGLDIRSIETLALSEVMQLNADALFSLQIFEDERHASIHSEKTKEGLSLAGMLNTTSTTLGRSLMRMWLLRPSLSLSVINARHDAVACFMRPENVTSANVLKNHLKGLRNLPRMLTLLRSGRAKLGAWQGLIKFTVCCALLRETLGDLHEAAGLHVVRKLNSSLDIASFRDVGTRINEIIDWEESIEAQRVCVRPHIDEELDNRKHVYHGIASVLSKVAEQISQTVPEDYATTLNVVYFPQLGFLICVPLREEWQSEEDIKTMNGWTFQFSSESQVYFKSQEMHDMDSHIGDLHSLIVDREIEIVQDLLEEVLVHDETIRRVCDVCAELDCLLAFADVSSAYEYRRPIMVEENMIEIVQGRHPLQEMVVDTFVPNDARLRGGSWRPEELEAVAERWNNVVICTGANACGKVRDREWQHLTNGLKLKTSERLFKINGAGLLCGVLKHLLDRGPSCPKVLVATHFHDIFREGLLDPCSMPITFLHMQVMFATHRKSNNGGSDVHYGGHDDLLVTGTTQEDDRPQAVTGEEIIFLYKAAEGLSLESHAAKCAEICGVPTRIIQRAQHVSEMLSNHEITQLLDEEMTDSERLDLENAEDICRRFLAWNIQEDDGENVKNKLGLVLGRLDE
ncbi:hypothetical protein E1B28_012352 [Marasmius oreades]|uniref:DNA mismatch repair protein MutS core domain-containing protein n=1 Tax=Marasmius oreades TaxID=181124 RepID=A0A9P7RSN0_9AGAR|nr:uncharacterized protein E1B28_012352 [Marasmius oreades]KAG7088348.1 hypothetical protein E1B28_012352 [Marasmius oreades]